MYYKALVKSIYFIFILLLSETSYASDCFDILVKTMQKEAIEYHRNLSQWNQNRFLQNLSRNNYDEYQRFSYLAYEEQETYLLKAETAWKERKKLNLTDLEDAWHPRHFTNPYDHRSDNFSYLIHSVPEAHQFNDLLTLREETLRENAMEVKDELLAMIDLLL